MRKQYQPPILTEIRLTGLTPLMDIYSLNDAHDASEEGNPPMDVKDNPHRYNVWDDDWQKEEKGGPL